MIELSKNQKVIFVLIILGIISVIGYYIWTKAHMEEYEEVNAIVQENNIEENVINTKNNLKNIVIHITGSITNPGIVKLQEGARIIDAIEAAGGLTQEADTARINLAYSIEDGQKIYIPSIHDPKESEQREEYITSEAGQEVIKEGESTKTNLVNINTAKQTELETIPGVGPSTATKIIEFREKNGKFQTIEDIKNVNGIGEAKFNNMKDKICVK